MLGFDFTVLADVNAALNGVATILIVAGLIAIKRGAERAHKRLMLSAAAVSVAFLASYLVYHWQVGSVRFEREGVIRTVYLAILIPHVILAAIQGPLILLTIWHGVRDNRAKHRRLAKFTAPIWLYVSVTGVVIWYMLYVM